MRTIGAAQFKAQCLRILDEVDEEGIVITKRGKPIAKLVPVPKAHGNADLIGSMRGMIVVEPEDDLLSTGGWASDEWGNLNGG